MDYNRATKAYQYKKALYAKYVRKKSNFLYT